MNIKRFRGIFSAVLFSFAFLLLTSCDSTDEKGESIEYVNKEVSYADGESCVERYLFYEESGEYERYIAGKYFGNDLPGIYFGTLFETGTYSKDKSKAVDNVTLSPKKQYDFDSKQLEYLGLTKQVPYLGTLTDETLTITWNVTNTWGFLVGEVPIIYERK